MITDTHKEQAREIVEGGRAAIHCSPSHSGDSGPYCVDCDLLEEQAVIDAIAVALASRDTEVREVLETFDWREDADGKCWCAGKPHEKYCVAARALYAKLSNEPAPAKAGPLPKPSRRKSKQERIAEDLKNSDVMARMTDRDNIEYGPHDSLPPCGEHVARLKRG